VNDTIYAPAALTSVKDVLSYKLERKLGVNRSRSGGCGEQKKLSCNQECNPGSPTLSITIIMPELTRLQLSSAGTSNRDLI
jgi:hypothetical protein